MNVRKRLVRRAESVCPDQPSIFLDTPAFAYVSASDLLAMCDTPQHKRFQGKQLRSRRKFDFCLAAEACPIEDDCFLREPSEFRSLAGFQLCGDVCRFVQCAI